MRVLLREKRRESGLTQYRLADMLGISRSYYSQIELGTKNPSFGTVVKIKLALSESGDELFANDMSAEKPKRGAPFKN